MYLYKNALFFFTRFKLDNNFCSKTSYIIRVQESQWKILLCIFAPAARVIFCFFFFFKTLPRPRAGTPPTPQRSNRSTGGVWRIVYDDHACIHIPIRTSQVRTDRLQRDKCVFELNTVSRDS